RKVTVPGVSRSQSGRSLALQSARSYAEIVLSLLAVYRVWLAGSTWASLGGMPGVALGSMPSWSHPDWRVALQVLASNTETPLGPAGHPMFGSPHPVTY